ncbi:MAG: pirin family protein [Betaproteobacteria bacterium]
MPNEIVLNVQPLGFPWQTMDPFLFCVHHDDAYPPGNAALGPVASLAGRELGQDFAGKDGWRMYHGTTVPGFPAHPHRGFETVTIVRRGLIDHADSLGATARFGGGDVQWLTAGSGIVHAEMFPLLDQERANPLELFQIWLNLPATRKLVAPHFNMFWAENMPRQVFTDAGSATTEVVCIAGRMGDEAVLAPPPDSWASRADADVAIWTIKMSAGARWMLPAAAGQRTRRRLYFFQGETLMVDGHQVAAPAAIELRAGSAVELVNGGENGELLLLQGVPINEPVAQQGPFVMNTPAEIQQAFSDYRRTGFGGWPWPSDAPVHAREQPRFAKHADGQVDLPG